MLSWVVLAMCLVLLYRLLALERWVENIQEQVLGKKDADFEWAREAIKERGWRGWK